MEKRIKKISEYLLFLILLISFVAALGFATRTQNIDANAINFNLTSEETGKIEIIKNGATEYSVVFSSDAISSDVTMATSIRNLLSINYGVSISSASDSVASTSNFEILLGKTNRPESAQLLELVNNACKAEDDLLWGYAVINGKLLYLANNNVAYIRGSEEFITYLKNNNFVIDANLSVIKRMSYEEYQEELRLQAEAEKQAKKELLLSMNKDFLDSQFNTDLYTGEFYKPMVGNGGYFENSPYGEPWAYPTEGQHPRFLVTEGEIDRMREILAEGENISSVYYNLAKGFWKKANTDIESIHYGKFQDQYKGSSGASWIPPTGESYRYDASYLAIIEAKALAYLITGDDAYALEAVVAIKNAILTLKYTTDLHQDTYHGASHVMLTAASVYDWCYGAMTDTDMWQIIWGVTQILSPQLEGGMQYPPKGLNGVNGHATGTQFLRDWMAVASAFYDEVPDWWEYCASAYFSVYLPVGNEHFKNGWVSQGTANYAPHKIYTQAYAAYVVYTATGERFLTDDAGKTMYYFISHLLPNQSANKSRQYYFQTGDGTRTGYGRQAGYFEYFLLSALYNDPVIYAQGLILSNYHEFSSETHNEAVTMTMTHAHQLCMAARVNYNGETVYEGLETIQYFADPAGQITIRESWDDPDSIAVMMRLLNRTMSNHENFSHGTFQIYYKGLLATNSGRYHKYGSDTHYYYHQATVADNGLLIFNPACASTDENSPSSYYYSGSQRRVVVGTNSVDDWLATAQMADTIGVSYGYDLEGNAKYAYLAGDLTSSYDAATVDYVGRRMLTIFTGDEDFPALFFTFDQIDSDKSAFTKHWLLHTVNEPEIDQENLTATIINGGGKMQLASLFGAEAIVKIGGSGKAWWINGYFTNPEDKGSWNEKTQSFDDESDKGSWIEGKNLTDSYTPDDMADTIWGRIELRTSGEKYSKLLTVLAISDKENEAELEINKFKTDDGLVYGAQIKKDIVAFLNNDENHDENRYDEFSFVTEGNGLYNYYVTGLEAGTWRVKVDGVSVAYTLSGSGGTVVTFVAPAGEVTIIPGADVIGGNGGKIKYVTGGAVLPPDAPYVYHNDTDFPLPTEVVRNSDVFLGWYTSPSFEPDTYITHIPEGTTGTYTVYAKWLSTFLDEDYSTVEFNKQAASVSANGVSYNGSSKKGSSFITKYDSDRGAKYFEWIVGENDPIISQQSETKNLSHIATDDKCVSFTFRIMLEKEKVAINSRVELQASKSVSGADISGNGARVALFYIKNSGIVTSNDGGEIYALSDSKITDIRIVVDFKNGQMRYYDGNYNEIASDKWNVPASVGTASHEEMLKYMTSYIWRMQGTRGSGTTDATLRFYGIRVQEGDEFSGKAKPQTSGIKYNTGGALLPSDAPREFNADGTETALPVLTKTGSVFLGWYTTPTFEKGTKTDCVPAGTTGLYEVYAKWKAIFVDEDYSETVLDITESSKTANGITYNGSQKPGSSYKTVDENGNKYLLWTPGEKDSLIVVQNETSNISTMTESAISYTLKLSRNADAGLPNFAFKLTGMHTVTGEASSTNSTIDFAKIIDGVFYLGSTTDYPVTEIGKDVTTIRLVLDFETGRIEAYDQDGEIINSCAFPKINSASGATTYLEYKNCFRNFLFNMRQVGVSAEKVDYAVRYYGIKIEEGNAFKVIKSNAIIYDTNGGEILGEYPKVYDPQNDTLLPTDIRKENFIFAGWYTTPAFDEGKKTDRITAGGTEPVTVYAKWLAVFIDEDYSETVLDISESSKTANGITYNGAKKPGSSYKTVDENGNKYLLWTPGEKDSLIAVQNETSNISTMTESAISYTLKLSRNADVGLPNFAFKLTGMHTVTGEASSTNSTIDFAKIIDGVFYLGNTTDYPVTEIGKDVTTIRLVLDFETGRIEAYDQDGEIINSCAFPKINSASGATTYLEYKNCFRNFLFNMRQVGVSAEKVDYAVRYYGIKIEEGNAFI